MRMALLTNFALSSGLGYLSDGKNIGMPPVADISIVFRIWLNPFSFRVMTGRFDLIEVLMFPTFCPSLVIHLVGESPPVSRSSYLSASFKPVKAPTKSFAPKSPVAALSIAS